MAEEGAPEPLHVEGCRRLERGKEVPLVACEPLSGPGRDGLRRGIGDRPGARAGVEGLDHLAVAVAAHEPHRFIQLHEPLDRLGRERPPGHVAADDDGVDALEADIGEHGVEGRDVAVDVVQGRDDHRATVSRYAARSAAAGQPGAPSACRTASRIAAAATSAPTAATVSGSRSFPPVATQYTTSPSTAVAAGSTARATPALAARATSQAWVFVSRASVSTQARVVDSRHGRSGDSPAARRSTVRR